MGRQSSRLYFQGKDHKDIYFQGHYHDAMYLSDSEGKVTLVWEKLKKVPLQGFTAICYYGGYYYVAYWNGGIGTNSTIDIYQGEQLNTLEYAYTIARAANFQNIFNADKHGFVIAKYSEDSTSTSVSAYCFDYLDNGNLDTKIKNSLDNPVNVAGGARLYYLYKRTKSYAYTRAFSDHSEISVIGDGGFTYTTDKAYMDTGSVFISENNIILPIQPYNNSAYPTMAERNYLHIVVCGLGGKPELKEVEIPYTIIDALYDEAYRKWKKAYPQYDTSKENAIIVYNLIENAVISRDYLIYQDVSLTTYIEYSSSFRMTIYHKADIKINLSDFSVTSFKIKDDYDINVISKFVCDEYSITLFRETTQANIGYETHRYIRYVLARKYDAEINIKSIKNIEVLGANESDIENNLRFVATYRREDYLYYSIYNFNNYLLEIDMKSNTAAIVQPVLYLKEG